jgi:hypothetical protein
MIGCYVAGTSAASLSSTSAADIAAVGAAIVVLGAVGAVTAFRSRHGCGLAASVGCCAVAAALEALCIIVAILTSSSSSLRLLSIPCAQLVVTALAALDRSDRQMIDDSGDLQHLPVCQQLPR